MPVQETVVLHGHIIDSLILSKVLDTIITMDGTFDLAEVHIGKAREDMSHAKIVVQARTTAVLEEILRAIELHGASVKRQPGYSLTSPAADTAP